jgi:hypothetical protein
MWSTYVHTYGNSMYSKDYVYILIECPDIHGGATSWRDGPVMVRIPTGGATSWRDGPVMVRIPTGGATR